MIERCLSWLQKKYYQSRIPFLTALLVGMLTYVFAFTNKLVNHDEACSLFAKGAGISSGRWGLDLISAIFPDYSMPWIYGVISVFLVSVASCVIINIFKIKSKILQGLLAGLVVSFPSLIGTFNYMFTASSYALAFFFSVIAVRLFVSKSKKRKLLAFVLMVFSLSIYQSYVSMAASLFLLVIIQRVIKEEGRNVKIIKEGISYVIFLGLALLCYYGITQIILLSTRTSMNSYASGSLELSVSSILSRVKVAYLSFFAEFRYGTLCLITTCFSRFIHGICLVILAIELVILWLGKKRAERIFLILTIVLLPLSINCMYLLVEAEAIHTLVLYSFVSLYIFAAIIVEECNDIEVKTTLKRCWKSFASESVLVAMLLVIITNVYIGNETYLHVYLKYENAYSFYTSLITQVKMSPEFDANSKLALVGQGGNLIHSHSEFSDIRRISGADGFSVNSYSRDAFIRNFIGIDIPFASTLEIEEVKKTVEFQEMAVYPYYGSIVKIGDLIVVKLSDS